MIREYLFWFCKGGVIAIAQSPNEEDKLIHGTNPNYGWLLKMDTENNDKHDYASSLSTTASARPKLVIQYSSGAVMPPEWMDRIYSPDKPHAVTAL